MMDTNDNTNIETSSSGEIGPISTEKLKEFWGKSYLPILNVAFKYQDEFTPYLTAIAKGLRGGIESLTRENSSEIERYVSRFFQEAADGLNYACLKLESKDVNALKEFLNEQAEKRPGLMFSSSYVLGIFIGRLAKHITNQPPSFDQPLN